MAHLEGRRKVHGRDLAFNGLSDLLAAMTGIAAPKASRAIQNLMAVDIGVIHARSACEQAWGGLELAVRRERHPEVIKTWRVGVVKH